MITALALFGFLSLVPACGALEGRKLLSSFNSNFEGWLGRPAAFLKIPPNVLAFFYEKARFEEQHVAGALITNLGFATLTCDGTTWEVRDDFLDASALSISYETSITAGDILRRPNGDEAKYYVVAYGTNSTAGKGGRKVHTRFADKTLTLDVKEKGYESDGSDPSLFEYEGNVYIVYIVNAFGCILEIAKTEDGDLKRRIRVRDALECRSPRLFQVDKKRLALVLAVRFPDSASITSVYYILDEWTTSWEIDNWEVFDAGREAVDFAFSDIDGKILSIGRYGRRHCSDGAQMGGFTSPRTISFDKNSQKLHQDPLTAVGPWAGFLAWNLSLKKDEPQYRDLCGFADAAEALLEFKFVQNTPISPTGVVIALSPGPHFSAGSTFFIKSFFSPRNDSAPGASNTAYALLLDNMMSPLLGRLENSARKVVALREVKGTLKVIFGKSIIEVYGEDGRSVLTGSHCITNERAITDVRITANRDLTLTWKPTVLRGMTIASRQPAAPAPDTLELPPAALEKLPKLPTTLQLPPAE